MIRERIEIKLKERFAPVHLAVIDESYQHNVPAGSESHFKIVIVSDSFQGERALTRHRAIYHTLTQEMAQGVHALALHTYTLAEWDELQHVAPNSPHCLGGGAKDNDKQ